MDGGAVLLDQEHLVEVCIGLLVHTCEQDSVAVSLPGGRAQVATCGGQPPLTCAATAGCDIVLGQPKTKTPRLHLVSECSRHLAFLYIAGHVLQAGSPWWPLLLRVAVSSGGSQLATGLLCDLSPSLSSGATSRINVLATTG